MASLRREAGPDAAAPRSAESRPHAPAARRDSRRSQGGSQARSGAPKAAAPAPRHVAPVALSGQTYTIQSGDTLSKIAEKLNIAGGWHLLADANTATISNPDLVFPGQVLQLPA